ALDTRAAVAALQTVGTPPNATPDVAFDTVVSPDAPLRDGLRGRDSIAFARIAAFPFDNVTLRNVRVRITADGAAAPQIDVPLADLFGDGLETRPLRAVAFGMN